MPNTRKKVIKTVYKDDEDSEAETGDFSDSGSEAKISEQSSSEEDASDSSGNEFHANSKNNSKKNAGSKILRKPKFAKSLVTKINRQTACSKSDTVDVTPALFSIKNLTDADKILPSFLNLSESDSSDDEGAKVATKKNRPDIEAIENASCSDNEEVEYKDVWSTNIQDDSEEIAKKTFMELEQHKTKLEETKATIQNYKSYSKNERHSDVKDLLALGEEVVPTTQIKKKKSKKIRDDSDSELDDWEEVKESKSVPQQGIQLFVEFPDAACRKTKKLDVEMMMKRKINRVKKEYQVYMHKVHVLCWLGHGNYISHVLNDQEIMAAALSLVPSKECYPGQRVDMKYVEQITSWYKDKLTLKFDKNEDKFRPKAPPLQNILLTQIKNRKVTAKRYIVFIFVSMLRALGLQCRVMFNFVTLPLKPLTSELCSLSTKLKDEKNSGELNLDKKVLPKKKNIKTANKTNISQLDGNDDFDNIMQVDGNNDTLTVKNKRTRVKSKNAKENTIADEDDGVSPPKTSRKCPIKVASVIESVKLETKSESGKKENMESAPKLSLRRQQKRSPNEDNSVFTSNKIVENQSKPIIPTRTRSMRSDKTINTEANDKESKNKTSTLNTSSLPKVIVTDTNMKQLSSKYFEDEKSTNEDKKYVITRKRSRTSNSHPLQKTGDDQKNSSVKSRTRSAPGNNVEKSQYFTDSMNETRKPKLTTQKKKNTKVTKEESLRVSHRDLVTSKAKPKNDVKDDLVDIIKNRVKEAKVDSKKNIMKGKIKPELDEDSDYLPEEEPLHQKLESDDDFKPQSKLSPRPSTSKQIDRRVLSPDNETSKNKVDVWCEIFVEELEQWVSVDVIRGKIHATNDNYTHATHPVCYVVGWDNNNYLKDLTRRYVPQWNTVTRKLRAEPNWWQKSIQPWLGPKTARDKEEDQYLDRMQLEAPLPKSIAEYKNHPLYALKRHLLKFEVIYPPDASILGFVRGEAVYARDCVNICRSRDTWLKEAKVVRLGEKPYKIVKARPKWDKLSNKLITDKPLEVFGPWQVQDYEPPVAVNGIVPRNAYGNVELFKDCMLPKGTAHIKLPGLNKVANKLNIDCAPAMTGFDFNGGWSHPVYDGFVVCKEFEEIITEAWVMAQEEQERKEIEKTEARVYGNWRRLIKGLFIRERLKHKYGFEEPSTSQTNNKSKGPRLVVKKRS